MTLYAQIGTEDKNLEILQYSTCYQYLVCNYMTLFAQMRSEKNMH